MMAGWGVIIQPLSFWTVAVKIITRLAFMLMSKAGGLWVVMLVVFWYRRKMFHGSTTAVLGAVSQRAVVVNTGEQGWLWVCGEAFHEISRLFLFNICMWLAAHLWLHN